MRLTVLKNHLPVSEVLVETPDLTERYEIFVGRSEDCHVLIDDPLISRHHFVLKNENGKWVCEKLSQLGIVSINGQSLPKMEIQEGDEVKCGVYSLLVSEIPRLSMPSAPLYQAPIQSVYTPAEDLASIDDMIQDTPEVEEMEMTEVIRSQEPKEESVEEEQDHYENNEYSEENTFSEKESSEESSSGEMLSSDTFGEDQNSSFEGGELTTTDDEVEEKTSFFKAFVNYQLVLFGDLAPYDRYQIDTAEIFIGRDPKKCQIVLDDPEVSTVHAVIRKNNIDITLEDLNSSNGTILNGERINRAHLSTGDEFVIGSTSFTLETRSDLLDAESDRLMPVERGQSIETEEIEEEVIDVNEMGDTDFNSEAPPEKSLIKRFRNDAAFRKKAIYALIAIVVIWYIFDSDEPAPKPEEAPVAKAQEPVVDKNAKPKIQLSKELEQKRNMAYELGISFFEQFKYFEALKEFQTVMEIDPEYKKIQTYFEQTKAELKNIEALEAQKREEIEKLKNKKLIEELMVKAREAVKEHQATLAENYFSQVIEKDPENNEVPQLRLELELWQKEQERIALEKAAKEASRKAMVDALNPGKTFYLKKEWYKAILKLEEFLRRKGTDEDLVKEGSDMLSDAKNQLASELGPLVGKARSLKEGQDLKAAYEAFLEVLKVEPTHPEALNEVDDIKNSLETRSKRLYREAIIAESLSLFGDAKEKFQEVQQVSPSDSEYYKKASEKLKNYLE